MSDAHSPNQTPAGARALRIGLFLGGRPLEERVLRRREPVTIGPQAGSTLIVPPVPDLGGRYTLFEPAPGGQGYVLILSEVVSGRLILEGTSWNISELLDESMPEKDGKTRITLDPDARGELRIGDLKILFQLIPAPSLTPRPTLPLSLRPRWSDLVDERLLRIALVSFLVHFGFVVYLRAMQRPKEPDLTEIPDSFVRMMVPKKIEPPKPTTAPKTEAPQKTEAKKEDEPKKTDAAKPKDKPKAEDPAAAAKAEAERLARVNKQVEDHGVLKMLLAKGPGGVLTDVLKDGAGDGDPDKVFSQVGGVGPATGSGGLGDTRGSGGAGTSKGIGGLVASGPSEGVGTGQKTEKQVKAVVTDSGPQELDPVDLDPAAVAAKIRQYRGALVACYEAALKKNPNLSGKITLRFTVGRVGKVTKVEIEVDTMHDEEVNQCIVDRASNWRFPAPQSGTDGVQFAYPFIFQSAK